MAKSKSVDKLFMPMNQFIRRMNGVMNFKLLKGILLIIKHEMF